MVPPYLTQDEAKEFDYWLMSKQGAAFSLDQLMEVAGLTVAMIIFDFYPFPKNHRVLITTGPGNNGGDGLVAARYLASFSYNVTVYRPKNINKSELFKVKNHLIVQILISTNFYEKSLIVQAEFMGVKIISELPSTINSEFDVLVDSIFGKINFNAFHMLFSYFID